MNQDMNGDTILVGILGFHGHSIEDASGLAAAHQKLKTSVAINRAAGQCWELCAQSCGSNEVCPEQVCQNDSLSLGRFPPRTSVLGGRKMRHCTSIAQQPRGLARPVRPTSTKTVRRTRGKVVRFEPAGQPVRPDWVSGFGGRREWRRVEADVERAGAFPGCSGVCGGLLRHGSLARYRGGARSCRCCAGSCFLPLAQSTSVDRVAGGRSGGRDGGLVPPGSDPDAQSECHAQQRRGKRISGSAIAAPRRRGLIRRGINSADGGIGRPTRRRGRVD